MEYLPFSEKVCEKVYYDGSNGWAVKYKDGGVVHVSDDMTFVVIDIMVLYLVFRLEPVMYFVVTVIAQ